MSGLSVTAVDRVRAAFARIAQVDRPDLWIHLRPERDVLTDAVAVDAQQDSGGHLPLAGLLVAVKDNIDVAGLPTTAGCPAYAYVPTVSNPAVEGLVAAGAIVLGKTNLDQFATGLVGTRSPYGVVFDSGRHDYVAGGSSSGSAVAVALGIADIGMGTDTAGSGRVPAAFQGIYGVKPTPGLVSVAGVVPACAGLDCVSLFVEDLSLGVRALDIIAAFDPTDPYSRPAPANMPLGAPDHIRMGVVNPDDLKMLSAEYRAAYAAAVDRLGASGVALEHVDLAPFLDASALLYGGAFVALRYAAFGTFVDTHPGDIDPAVGAVLRGANDIPAYQLAQDQDRLSMLARQVEQTFSGIDVLALPTTIRQPTLAEVAADPWEINAELGAYTHFCNLLDLCAVAVPAGEAAGGSFGMTLFAPAFHDRVVLDAAARFAGVERVDEPSSGGIPIAVFGAHLRGQALNHQLVGGRFIRDVHTAAEYEMYALDTTPPKPGLLRVGTGGHSITGELWCVPATTLATVLAELPGPLTLGKVRLSDGAQVVGFLAESAATTTATNISSYGSWPAYLATQG